MENTQHLISRRTGLGHQKGLIELVFRLPYCRIADVVQADIAKRQTAAPYLQQPARAGLLVEQVQGRENLYPNHRLSARLKSEANELEEII